MRRDARFILIMFLSQLSLRHHKRNQVGVSRRIVPTRREERNVPTDCVLCPTPFSCIFSSRLLITYEGCRDPESVRGTLPTCRPDTSGGIGTTSRSG